MQQKICGTMVVNSGLNFLFVEALEPKRHPIRARTAGAPVEADISKLEPGQLVIVKWRGKPIFIRKRSQDEIDRENAVPMAHLRDQETDEERCINPEFIVVIGICPHLGCVPLCDQGEYNGWFCPCHGSHYDLSGRIRKGPAPLNLEVPPYKYIQDEVILMG